MTVDITSGVIRTADRQVGIKQDMDEAIAILTPSDVPFQQWLGTDSTTSVKVEWMDEDLTPQHVTVASVTGTDSPWTVTLGTGEAGVLRPGDLLHLRDGVHTTQWVVTSINLTDDTAVIAGFAGCTVDPLTSDVLEIIGQYRTEGAAAEDPRTTERAARYNLTQWGQEKVEATRTARKVAMFAKQDPYDHELQKKFKELAIRWERSAVFGVRAESNDKTKRFMNGAFAQVTDNTSSGVKANIKTLIGTLIRKCYEDGGTPGALWVSPAIKEAIDAVDATERRTTRTESTAGEMIDKFVTSFGTVDVHLNRHFPKTKALLLQSEYCERVNFDPYFHETLAKTSDGDSGHIVGESTMKVKNDKAHGVLTVTDAT